MTGLFNKDFETGELTPLQLGRFIMQSRNIIRLVLFPDGLKVAMPRSSMTNGDLLFFDDSEFGLGMMPEKKEAE